MRREESHSVVAISGDWIARNGCVDTIDAAVTQIMAQAAEGTEIAFDVAALGRWDSGLIAMLWQLRTAAAGKRAVLQTAALPAAALRLLALLQDCPPQTTVPAVLTGLSTRLGQRALATWTELLAVCALLGDSILHAFGAMRGGSRMQGGDLVDCLRDAGGSALPIVAIVNFLVGGILAFVGAVQLRRFGADVFVANLVGIALVREMAAVMTAIVMAGRTGGAYAAHIATMQGNEEIDALRATGIPVQDYLILPRVLALTATMPLLYLYGCAIGLLGGMTVAIGMLAITPTAYFEQTRAAVSASQFVFGFSKSIAFGALVALAGCHIGLRAGRSASDVGNSATRAVVVGIVGVIALDAVFAICANALDF